MDPNETLRLLREYVTEQAAAEQDWPSDEANARLDTVTELVDAIDGWLARGGYLPTAWQDPYRAAAAARLQTAFPTLSDDFTDAWFVKVADIVLGGDAP